MALPDTFCFVDIETTGGSLKKDRIIDIGILKVVKNKVVQTFESLIDPQTYLPPEITRLTGITQADLEKAPTFTNIQEQIFELLYDSVFVAHNADFDYRFVKEEFKRRGVKFSGKRLCTVKLSRFVNPEYSRHNLDEVIARHNLACDARHRGFGDAKVLWDLFKVFKREYNGRFVKALEHQLKKPNTPVQVNPQLIFNLPEGPGVYTFYSGNTPIYIGKSKNVKKRIQSHLSSSNSSPLSLKILSQTTQIDVLKTAGELEALIQESLAIKKFQPLYNKKLRHSRQLTVLKLLTNPNSYFEIKPEVLDKITVEDIPNILGVFKSIKQAKEFLTKKAQEHNLCDKLLDLEKTSRHCFGHMLGRCNGACIGKENFLKYNIRVQEAFKNTFKPWPFEGPIAIEEAEAEDKKVLHLVDKWCYLGNLESESDIDNLKVSRDLKFDVDLYKILYSFISNEKNMRMIKRIQPSVLTAQDQSF